MGHTERDEGYLGIDTNLLVAGEIRAGGEKGRAGGE